MTTGIPEYTFRAWYIAPRMFAAIRRYIEHGTQPGDFLTAVICNNLKEAVARADDENMGNLPAFVAYFYNEAPAGCWGSAENMRAWMAAHQSAVAEAP